MQFDELKNNNKTPPPLASSFCFSTRSTYSALFPSERLKGAALDENSTQSTPEK